LYCSLTVYLLLVIPIICIAILPRLGHAIQEERVYRVPVRDTVELRQPVSPAAACCDMGWISAERGVRCDCSVAERLEARVNAEGGHSEHLLWRCLLDIPVATHQNLFFSEPPIFEGTQQTVSQTKKLYISQVNVVIFSCVVVKWVTVCFLLR